MSSIYATSIASSSSSSSPSFSPSSSSSNLEPVDNSNVYKVFGRDTAAGRALFKIYNKGKTDYNPIGVRLSVKPSNPQDEHLRKKKEEAAAKVGPKYKAPRLKKVQSEEVAPRPYIPYGGKKSEDVIKQEMKENPIVYRPVNIGMIESREEKVRKLQNKFSGAPAEKPAPLPGRMPKTIERPIMPERDPNEELYDSILSEIEERQNFLDEMYALGQGEKYEATIKAEISQRLRDLKKLDAVFGRKS